MTEAQFSHRDAGLRRLLDRAGALRRAGGLVTYDNVDIANQLAAEPFAS